MSFITDDIEEMLDDDDFGLEIKLNGKTFNAIPSQEFTEPEQMAEPDERESTVVYCDSRHVSGASFGDEITVDSVDLYIRAIQPDGTGITILVCSDTM